MRTHKQLMASRRNIKIARRAWKGMSHIARQKAMPPQTFGGLTQQKIKQKLIVQGKRYVAVGEYAWLDIGRPRHHYILVQKTKFGWEKKSGLVPLKTLQKGVARARRTWMQMSPKERARAMPSRK